MIIEHFKKQYTYIERKTGKTISAWYEKISITCDKCGEEHSRDLGHYNTMKAKFPEFDRDYCNSCWKPILNNRPQFIENMRNALKQAYIDKPELRDKMSKIVKGRNAGDKNPMKRAEVRQKVSNTRTKLMQDSEFRAKFKQPSLDAWARGAYDHVFSKNMQAKWHDYQHSNGKLYKVQGRYELAFIRYLDEEGLAFDCHRGKIPYMHDDGFVHHYLPDFYVHAWCAYVDPKANYWFERQHRKFELLAEQHPELKILVLTEEKLRNLGIKL